MVITFDDDNDGDGLVCLEVRKRHQKRIGDGSISPLLRRIETDNDVII